MAHFSNYIEATIPPFNASREFVSKRVLRFLSHFRANRRAKTDIAYLAEYSDAELADIGLLRSEISEALFENAADAQAEALLRVYQ